VSSGQFLKHDGASRLSPPANLLSVEKKEKVALIGDVNVGRFESEPHHVVDHLRGGDTNLRALEHNGLVEVKRNDESKDIRLLECVRKLLIRRKGDEVACVQI
jgi:hypothetical protein